MNLKQGEDQLTDVTNYTIDKFYLTQVSFVFCPRRSDPEAVTTPEWPVSDVPGNTVELRLITAHENHLAPHVSSTTIILKIIKYQLKVEVRYLFDRYLHQGCACILSILEIVRFVNQIVL